jgi:hypothetical protein
VLTFPERYLQKVDDYYQAYMINKRAGTYGVKDPAQNFHKQLVDIMKEDWLDGFDTDKFTLKSSLSQETGVTLESIRLVEMISSLVGDATVGERASKTAAAATQSLIALASATSGNENTENQIFFVAPKNAYDPQSFDLT